MGDVFDAMNRAKREKGDEPSPEETPPLIPEPTASDQEGVDVQSQSASTPKGKEKPGLPIDEVPQGPSAYQDEEDVLEKIARRRPNVPQDEKVVPASRAAIPASQADEKEPLIQHEDEKAAPTGDPTPLPALHQQSLNGYSSKVIVHHDRGSVITEQYRAIRTQILARAKNRRLQAHVITSSMPEEGKSVSTINLGIAFSELRSQNTLVIEGDLRRPSFHKLFDRECTPGLLQLLRGDVTDIDSSIHQTVYDNLQFMPAGGRDPTHSTELLSSPRMAQILDRLRDHYDHIFIDTPPVVSVTDAAILAALGDQTLLVVRLHKTPIDMVDRAKRLLRSNDCNVSGIILTHMKVAYLPKYLGRYSYSYGSAYA